MSVLFPFWVVQVDTTNLPPWCAVVMLSRDEWFWIVNYIYSDRCDRNYAVFMSRDDFDEKYCEVS